MPTPNSPVINLMTGGIDSPLMACVLMETYHLKLYPLFLRWGQYNLENEEEALDYFTELYLKNYPKLFNRPKKVKASIPINEFLTKTKDIVVLRNLTFAIHAVHYADYLEETQGIKIRTIFSSSVASDGRAVPDSTLIAIRATNLSICLNESDFSWQYTSLALEKTLGFYFYKDFLIKFARQHGVPVEKTWSCYQGGKIHCGECLPCQGRKEAFKMAGIKDPTKYYRPGLIRKFGARIRKKISQRIKKR